MISGSGRIGLACTTLLASLVFVAGIGCAGKGGSSTGAAGAAGTNGSGAAGAAGSAATGSGGTGSGRGGAAGDGTAGSGTTTGLAGTTGGGAGAAGHAGSAGTGLAGTSGGAGTSDGAGTSGSAGTSGGAAGAGDPCSTRPGLVFCDNFEEATSTVPPAPWTTTGTVTVDSATPAHSGQKSIHIGDTANDYDTLLILHDAGVLPAAAGRFYVRVFMQISMPMSAQHNTFILSDLFANQGAGNALRLGEDDSMLMFTLDGDTHAALSNANYYNDGKPGIQFTPGVWTCLEVLLDSKKPEIDVWVGGVEVPDLHHTDFPIDDYDNLRFGFEKYAGPAMDIWYDDIAVGTQPIGCN
jgi:hypothetical protein